MDQENKMQPVCNNNTSPLPMNLMAPIHHIISTPNQQDAYRPVGPGPVAMTCPNCRCRIKTNVRHRATVRTHKFCFLLIPLCCCCLPYCMATCRNANHFCPMCETFLGTYQS